MIENEQLTRTYLRWIRVTVIASILLPLICMSCTLFMYGASAPYLVLIYVGGIAIVGFLLTRLSGGKFFDRCHDFIDEQADRQAQFLASTAKKWLAPAIVLSAALSLFAELTVIRWQGTVWLFFAFYKNLGLLACFAGLGIGYSLSAHRRIPLLCAVPLFAWQIISLIFLRYALPEGLTRSLLATPVPEQFNMGIEIATRLPEYIVIYLFMAIVFCLTALCFIPIGQLCGNLMTKDEPLRAYGLNLFGSLIGVILLIVASFFWTPPVIWFSAIFAVIIFFVAYEKKSLIFTAMASLIAVTGLAWPVNFGHERVYSPYQLIERELGPHGGNLLSCGGAFMLLIADFSPKIVDAYPDTKPLAYYYNLPYSLVPNPARVAIIGAGSGNDVAAALRGNAQHVDAIEIDPALQKFGEIFHPEKPFQDPRVTVIINDARAFLRTTKDKFDLIVFGVLDSHTLSSHASSLRLDSYVYTTECFREARAHLSDQGMLCLSFCAMNEKIAKKIYLMLDEAFDHHPPVCIHTTAYTFIQSKNGDFKLPTGFSEARGFQDFTPVLTNPNLHAEQSTDDWPFLYMPRRVYPYSYIPMFALVLLLSGGLVYSLQAVKISLDYTPFFFLGAGFMLIETKAITELGLNFGNTWYVIGLVIAAIMLMAYMANLFVATTKFKNTTVSFILLLGSIALGYGIALAGGYPGSSLGKIENIAVLTGPMFFSGIIFSSLISKCKDISAAMAINLIGAMLGGLLEYNAMYFGYRALYILALAIYALAFLSSFRQPTAD